MTIIQIDADIRLRVEQDADASNPRGDDGWDMMTGFVNIPERGDSRYSDVPAVHEDPTGRVLDAWERIVVRRECNNCAWAPHKPSLGPDPEHVVRWARIFHVLTLEWDAEHGGFWFVSPSHNDADPSNDAIEIIKAERSVYETWAKGEVYGVVLERRVEWKPVSETDQPRGIKTTWEDDESIWGCYLDDTYTAESVAKEHWGVSK
jgi:hypothetical protein